MGGGGGGGGGVFFFGQPYINLIVLFYKNVIHFFMLFNVDDQKKTV